MSRLITIVSLLAASAVPVAAATTPLAEPDVASMKAGIERLRNATLAGEFADIADQMHPRIIEVMGGRDAALELIESSYGEMRTAGYAIESMSADPPAQAHVAESELVAIVPMFLVVASDHARISSSGFLVASRPKSGGAWVFIDGSAILERKALDMVFPGLPEDVPLPEKQQSVQQLGGGVPAP